eukprot:3604577-Rhodomonas_salina.9
MRSICAVRYWPSWAWLVGFPGQLTYLPTRTLRAVRTDLWAIREIRNVRYERSVWCGTDVASGAVLCCALCGTELAYGAMCCARLARYQLGAPHSACCRRYKHPVLPYPIILRAPYAVSGTDTGYRPTQCAVLTETIVLRNAWYSLSIVQ